MIRTDEDTEARTSGGAASGRMVEAWLRHSLASAYDPVIAEKLPPDLLALLAEFA